MTTRTTCQTVTFTRPFALDGIDGMVAPGAYLVETDEERIDGLSFPVWRPTATLIHLPGPRGLTQTLPIDPAALDKALQWDRNTAINTPRPRTAPPPNSR